MARNWATSASRTRALRAVDALLWPVALLTRMRGRHPLPQAPRILVFEFWNLGDAVMVEPLLRALRARFPEGEISLLCRRAARTLLEPRGLVDRFFEIDVPWTAFENKYAWREYVDAKFVKAIRVLRRERFDLTIDSRMDLRSNLLAWILGARRRVGFDVPGGRGLLTDRVRDRGEQSHKVTDWLAMLDPFGGAVENPGPPVLSVREATQGRVDAHLAELGVTPDTILVGMHPSARHTVRRWPLGRFAEVASTIGNLPRTRVMVLVDPDGYGQELAATGALCVNATVEELPAYLRRCSAFVGNDTGPAHIAAAVGVPTTTIFGPGAIEWFRPFGPGQRVVAIQPMLCRPCFDRCTQPTNICLQELSVEIVLASVRQTLESSPGAMSRVDGRQATGEIDA